MKLLEECEAGECCHDLRPTRDGGENPNACLAAAIEAFDKLLLACAGSAVGDAERRGEDTEEDAEIAATICYIHAKALFDRRNRAVCELIHKTQGLRPPSDCLVDARIEDSKKVVVSSGGTAP